MNGQNTYNIEDEFNIPSNIESKTGPNILKLEVIKVLNVAKKRGERCTTR